MAIIFNSKECGITKEEMKLLYRYNLMEFLHLVQMQVYYITQAHRLKMH